MKLFFHHAKAEWTFLQTNQNSGCYDFPVNALNALLFKIFERHIYDPTNPIHESRCSKWPQKETNSWKKL